jgi:uncharacterized protein (TIGR00369 family)
MSEHHRKLERMYLGAPVNRWYQPSIEIGDGTATIGLDAREDFFHSLGAVHGSVLFKLLDDACFFACSALVEDVFVLTVSFTTYFTRPVSRGRMISRGRVVHGGRNLLLAEAVITDENDKEVGRGSGSFVRSAAPLAPEIGYR